MYAERGSISCVAFPEIDALILSCRRNPMCCSFVLPARLRMIWGCAFACLSVLPTPASADLLEDGSSAKPKKPEAALSQPASSSAHYKLTLVRSTDKQIAARGHGGTVYQVAVTPDGKRVLIGGDSRTPLAMLWNIETGEMERYFDIFDMGQDGSPVGVAIGPDGNRAALATTRNKLFLVELDHRNSLYSADWYGFTFGMKYSPDGTRLVLFESTGDLIFVDCANAQERFRLKGHSAGGPLCFSPDGRRLISSSSDKTARIWDLVQRKQSRVLKHDSWVWSVAFSPDGKRVATGTGGPIQGPVLNQNYVRNDDNKIRLWDAATGDLLQTFSGHDDRVEGIQFVRGGKCLVSGSYDGSLRLWDVATGQELASFKGQTAIFSVAAGKDDTIIAGGGSTRDPKGHWRHVPQERVRVLKIEEVH
jgi:WD40 repeat protein